MDKKVAISTLATTLLGACATSPDAYYASQPRCELVEPDVAVSGGCFAVPQVRDYLEQVQKQVIEAWQLPRGISADQRVSLTFRLRPDGSMQCLSLASGLREDIAESVVSALRRVTPFSRVPPEAACLTELPITATFSNPVETP